MRRVTPLFAAVVLVAVASSAASEIQSGRLLDHIKFLSSDDLKGRGNGSDGLARAADYVRTSSGSRPSAWLEG